MRLAVASKCLGGQEILKDIAFDLVPGGITALCGPSGVGKTTLLRIAAGLDRDYRGPPPPALRVGMMFQEPRLFPWLTAFDNIAVVGNGAAARADGLLQQAGLAAAARLYPRQLSLGMARRVALARAVAVEPELLLLDEPFASLDKTAAAAMADLIRNVSLRHGTAILMVTHDPADAALAQRVVVLGGRPASIVSDQQYPGASAPGVARSGS